MNYGIIYLIGIVLYIIYLIIDYLYSDKPFCQKTVKAHPQSDTAWIDDFFICFGLIMGWPITIAVLCATICIRYMKAFLKNKRQKIQSRKQEKKDLNAAVDRELNE